MTYGLNLENERHSRGILDVASGQFDYIPFKRTIDARQLL